MSNEENNSVSMGDLLKEYDVKRLNKGDVVTGVVISVNADEAMANINFYKDGVIKRDEASFDNENVSEILNAGDSIEVMILSMDDGEGNVVLSKKRADEILVWDEIKESLEDGRILNVTVKEEVRGGIVANYKGVRVFIPGSQVSRERGKDLSEFISKELEVKIIELDRRDKRVVASRRVVEEEIYNAEKKILWDSLVKGEKRQGKVTRTAKFGAFVDIGGIEGLIHISDLSWGRVNKPEEVVNVGEAVEVYVGDFDREKGRVSLILKDVKKDPWEEVSASLKSGNVVSGKVVKLAAFGAFVELLPGVEGLVHISEISEDNIAKASDVLAVGQDVKVKILDIDLSNKKISLSIKDAEEKSKEYEQYNDSFEGESLAGLFKDIKF
ncbi:MAG: 30S ribosomal protein S1 [Clostridiaceae bacterium]